MRAERVISILVVAGLFLAGALAWRLQLRAPLVSAPMSLARIPVEFVGFRGIDLPMDGQVESMLDADQHVQRAYEHPIHGVVWLYVGYYGSARGGTPEHTPRVCYAAHSWDVVAERELAAGSGLRVQEYRVGSGDEERLVHFYYRSFRSTGMTNLLALRADHFFGNLTDGRADGALIRLSSPLGMDEETTVRSRLLAFSEALEPHLAENWPKEAISHAGPGL